MAFAPTKSFLTKSLRAQFVVLSQFSHWYLVHHAKL